MTPVTRNALEIRRPARRHPQIKISGVGPSIVPAMLLDQVNGSNNLSIAPEDLFHPNFVHRKAWEQSPHCGRFSNSVYTVNEKGKAAHRVDILSPRGKPLRTHVFHMLRTGSTAVCM
ncbi:hypothetical protein HPB48_007183 [Haemaphysalis longicornis]|uniref:Uncharacterized protein n=1 Tax=Haemaphysalis longicornis TaxID=44386 RepID=A0A9J6G286_HAELO|nr:hypothetical protein HPB48_007183 [Haemaphysalis longicornis]